MPNWIISTKATESWRVEADTLAEAMSRFCAETQQPAEDIILGMLRPDIPNSSAHTILNFCALSGSWEPQGLKPKVYGILCGDEPAIERATAAIGEFLPEN